MMDVHAYLKTRQGLIDRSLNQYLGACRRHPETLFKAMQYSVFSGGKRIRPILTLAAGDLFGAARSRLLPFACAVEFIHTYSLIHDDLPALDNDDLRRGKPTSHKIFGEGIALLAGDALLTEAFDLVARLKSVRSLRTQTVLDLIHELAHAAGIDGMVGGQSIDLEAENGPVDLAMVEEIHMRKTGALILVSARLGAMVGGAPARDLGKISRYGRSLGLAFQITDDLLDVGVEATEKARRQAQAGELCKATYPSVVGIRAAKQRAEELMADCLKELKGFGKKADPLREIARYVVGQTMA